MLTSLSMLQAQEQLTGVVVQESENGEFSPVSFANVFWLNTQIGATTDTSGTFVLPFTKRTNKLVVSYVGYKADTIEVTQKDKMTIILKQSNTLGTVDVVYREKSTSISYMDPLKTENIGEDELYKAACCNLSESFETNPSVDVAFTDAVTGTKQIQMLGLDGKYTQITLEQLPEVRGLASVQGLTYIPGVWVQGIQLNKGAGSVVNGFESVTGQINVELKKPETTDRWFINGYGNQGGRSELNVSLKQKVSDKVSTGLLAHGSIRPFEIDGNEDGYLDFPTGNHINVLNRWRFNSHKGWEGQAGVRVLSEEMIGGQTAFNADAYDFTPVGAYGLGWQTNRYQGWIKTGYVFPEAKYKSIGIQASAIYHDFDSFFGTRQYDATQQTGYLNVIYQSIISTSTHKFRTGGGVLYDRYDESLDSLNFDREEIVPGAFFEYTLNVFDKFGLVAGLRGDYHNYYGFFVTPRLHMRYEIVEGSVLRFSGGRGQRTANVIAENISLLATSRQWIINGNANIPGFGLRPEVAWNLGANFTQDFRLNYRPGLFSIDAYHTEFENQTVIDRDQNAQQVNVYNLSGRSYATSLQAQVDYELLRRFDVRLAYRWYDVMTTYDGFLRKRPFVATHRAFINLAYETLNGWAFDYTINWQDKKRIPITAGNPAEFQAESESPSIVLMNAQVTKTWNERFAFYIGMENITNVRQTNPILAGDDPYGPYFDSSLIWGPIFGRMAYVGFRLSSKKPTP